MNKETIAMVNKLNETFKKSMGQDVIFTGDDTDSHVTRIPSGSLALDLALGGGWPRGRVVEIFGPESGGKTTIATMAMAEAQKKIPNKAVAFIDVERSFDINLAIDYGVDPDNFIYSKPVTGENAFDIMEALIVSDMVSMIVLDSVAALIPSQEQQADMVSQQMGLQARLIGKGLRKLSGPAADHDVMLVFINQLREKVGVMYGNPETTPGGRALKFFSSVRLRVAAGEPIKEKDEQIGHLVNCRTIKNKTAQPYKLGAFKLIYGQGVDRVQETAEIAVELGLIKKGGAWLSIVDETTGEILQRTVNDVPVTMRWQGLAKFVEYLKVDSELLSELNRKISENGTEPETEAGS